MRALHRTTLVKRDHETMMPLRSTMEEHLNYAVLTKVAQELTTPVSRQLGNTRRSISQWTK